MLQENLDSASKGVLKVNFLDTSGSKIISMPRLGRLHHRYTVAA